MPPPQPIRVVLVEDQTAFRELLAEVLMGSGYAVVGQFSKGNDALAACPELRPNLVILDAVLPDCSGLDVLAQLHALRPAPRVLVVTAHERPALVQAAIRLGARGFVTKGTPLSELREGIERVVQGATFFCSTTSGLLARSLQDQGETPTLTPRQRAIVQRVARGLSSKEIAEELGLSVKTVNNHRLQIATKLGLRDVASFTRYAIEHGLVEPKA